jgi:hypothetical protein
MDIRNREWLQLVKATREKFGVSIQGAHDLILADVELRRLVGHRINRDPECRKLASYDIAQNGDTSRFERDGDRIRFRHPDGQCQ